MNGIYSIEELILKVRDSDSKEYIEEAFSAYRGSAFRASIVSIWIAVVHDIISKLRELAELGDAQAELKVKELDKLIKSNDPRRIEKLQKFENGLLDVAFSDYELFNETEYNLIKRIKQDRNLCAHPAFVDSQHLFQPTPELVRSHLVHAIKFILIIEPVQGKAAFEKIINDLKRGSFPKEFYGVKQYLNSKYFRNAKDVLIKNVCTALLTGLIKGEIQEQDQKLNVNNTLAVIESEFRSIYEMVITEKLDKAISTTSDDNLWNTLLFLSKNMYSWNAIKLHNQLRIVEFVKGTKLNSEKLERNFDTLKSISIPVIKEALSDKVSTLEEIAIQAIDKYGNSSSYSSALQNGKRHILPNISFFNAEHVNYLIEKVISNRSNQIIPASGSEMILESVFTGTIHLVDECKTNWKKLNPLLEDYDNKYISLIRRINEI